MARNLAVLVGNGLSVAFNPDLMLQSITTEELGRVEGLKGGDVVRAMKALAAHALPEGAKSDEDFEVLVGAFVSESRSLGILSSLARYAEPEEDELRKAIASVTKFAERVRDNAISHVLEVIAERSFADHLSSQHLHSLVREIAREFEGKIVYANLNYDTLLLAALLTECKGNIVDMADGLRKTSVRLDDGSQHSAWRLRGSASDFPSDKRIQLLHLHGSLTHWTLAHETDERFDEHLKFPKHLLQRGNQWTSMRDQSTAFRPAIVLASRWDKAEHVKRFPFSLAYEMFAKGLDQAQHWLIIGYSFRDDPVNERLRKEFAERDPKPQVLVVTFEDDPEQHTVERAFGWNKEDGPSDSWLRINRAGANGVNRTQDWASFTGP